jgi:DNA polymerase-3 subunit epsilon
MSSCAVETIAVIDFETTGSLPAQGDRPTEVAIVLLQDGQIVDRYQSLMCTGLPISPFVVQLTGITQAMADAAPPAEVVMAEACRFVGDAPMVAHNASFDRKFWVAELARLNLPAPQPYACTVLLSRRLYQDAPNHKLGSLVDFHGLPRTGAAHRALADAEMTAHLLALMQRDLREQHGIAQPDHAFLCALQQCGKPTLARWLAAQRTRCA